MLSLRSSLAVLPTVVSPSCAGKLEEMPAGTGTPPTAFAMHGIKSGDVSIAVLFCEKDTSKILRRLLLQIANFIERINTVERICNRRIDAREKIDDSRLLLSQPVPLPVPFEKLVGSK
jgi:hypothetical protein